MKISTRQIVIMALLLALDVVFTRIIAINTNIMRIGLGFAAIAVCGMLYGPIWSAVVAAMGDVIGSLLFPTGAYFFPFTVTAACTGLIFGLCLYKRKVTWKNAVPAAALNSILISFLANTYLITLLSGASYKALLATRSVQLLINLPVQSLVILAIGASPALFGYIKKTAGK